MGGMFGCLRLDVIGVWGRGDPSRSYVASHLGFLLTKGHHYNDHFSTLIYVPYLGTLLILHQVYGFIVNNFIFFSIFLGIHMDQKLPCGPKPFDYKWVDLVVAKLGPASMVLL